MKDAMQFVKDFCRLCLQQAYQSIPHASYCHFCVPIRVTVAIFQQMTLLCATPMPPPPVILTQQSNMRSRIFKHRLYALTVLVDETSDTDGDREPINIVIVTSEAAYFVDTIFVDAVKDDEKYGDVFGKTFVEWWDRFFTPYDDPNTCPLRDVVRAFVTDNVNYNVGAFKRHWAPPCMSAALHMC